MPEVDIIISGDSEILVKGPNVSSKYFCLPIHSLNCYHNGYLKTGDLGVIPEEGFLRLVGRIKTMIVLSTGKKVLAETIEDRLCQHKLIDNAVLIGNDYPYISCVLITNQDELMYFADKNNIPYKQYKDLISNKELQDNVQNIINSINEDLAEHEQIQKFIISTFELTSDELTPTSKIKRDVFLKNRPHLLRHFYRTR